MSSLSDRVVDPSKVVEGTIEGEGGQRLSRLDAKSELETRSLRLMSRGSSFGAGIDPGAAGLGGDSQRLSGIGEGSESAVASHEVLALLAQLTVGYEELRKELEKAKASNAAAQTHMDIAASSSRRSDDSSGGSSSQLTGGSAALERARRRSAKPDPGTISELRQQLLDQEIAAENAEEALEEARKELEMERAARVAAEEKLAALQGGGDVGKAEAELARLSMGGDASGGGSGGGKGGNFLDGVVKAGSGMLNKMLPRGGSKEGDGSGVEVSSA